MASSLPRLLILQPSINPAGGGNGVAVHAIEALKTEAEITLVAWERVDAKAINAYYGTSLKTDEIRVLLVPRILDFARRISGMRAALFQRYVLMRYGRRFAKEFDLTISFNNEIDVGQRAVQYIHFPWGFWPRPDADLQWFHRLPGLLSFYYRLGERLAPVSAERIAANRTLVNSDWTGERFIERYGGEVSTLYPPASGAARPLPWSQRDSSFVILGRITPHKGIETAVDIVRALRERGHDATLRIVGSRVERGYARQLRKVASTESWIDLRFDVSRAELETILASSRYGLHANPDEHFGIAVAEMILSGCIPFVPRGAGQIEIVNGDERIVWSS
ncbi:MAG TPA: glycosyltransferase, partial [Thermoanaerobaculia bacterium]|nr:glycosyltransferase [Thermoanaerobaculia bacterium]